MITFTYKSCTKQDFERFENIFVENKNNSPISVADQGSHIGCS